MRNLTQECTEEKLKETFQEHGHVQRVKKLKDYAFVHFEERDDAVTAMEALQGQTVHGANLEISLAKPPSDRKKKEELLKARERRLMQQQYGTARPAGLVPVVPPPFRGVRPPIRGGSVSAAAAVAAQLPYARGKLASIENTLSVKPKSSSEDFKFSTKHACFKENVPYPMSF